MTLERKTVHISDDTGRVAMFEYRSFGSDPAPQELMRYVYSNHLQSSMLELDDQGQIISYEEYHPFGTTAYQATNASINAVAKRYRYTGKERDDESGLYYHGARYYIPWLARWSQCDPIGIKDGLNVYAYCSNNPVMLNDPSGTSGSGGTEEERPKNENEKKQSQEETKHSLPNVTITGQRQDFDWEQILNRVLNALKDTSIDVLTVIAGFSNAWISNQALGIGRQDPREFQGNQKAFLLGQVIGDLFSMIQGGAEIFGGFRGAQALAVALDSTGFGAVAGVILHAGGAELGLHGIALAGTATYQMGRTLSMMSSVSGGGGGGYNNNEEDTNSQESNSPAEKGAENTVEPLTPEAKYEGSKKH